MTWRSLRSRRDFLRVQASGKRVVGKHLVLLWSLSNDTDTHVGLTVSRRVGNAVKRNKLRRRLREIIRHQWEELAKRCDYVVVAKSGAAKLSFNELKQELWFLFQRAHKQS